MRALVLGGAGAMGRWTVRDLTESVGVDEVCVADVDGPRAMETAGWAAARAGSTGTAQVWGTALDAGDPDPLRRAFEPVDVVVNCAFHATNVPVMEACADTGTHYVDLGGLFHTTRRQLTLHDRFAAAGSCAVVGMGASPGTTNVMAALAARELDTVESVEIRLGIADFAGQDAPLPLPYAASTLLDEFTMPAMVWRGGRWNAVPAMSEQEELEFPAPVGRVRVGHTLHSEVATLPRFLADRGVESVSFKVGFPPDFMERMNLLVGLGLTGTEPVDLAGGKVIPRELLLHLLTVGQERPGPEAKVDDAEAIRVRVGGRRAGTSGAPALAPVTSRRVEVLAECMVRPHPTWGAGAGQLDTGVPPSIVAQFLAGGVIQQRGVFAPESVVPPEPYFAELARRFMEVSLVTRTMMTG
ncbi:MAG TPA: saccharopine dehydrogenase C-terminal domain-containing protein [Actinomycetes bacterium]